MKKLPEKACASPAHARDRARTAQPTPSNLLAGLNEIDREALFGIGQRHTYAKGEPVFSVGGSSDCVHFLISGKVRISQPSPLGREVTLWYCLPGEIFGLAEVAHGGDRTVSASAVEEAEVLSVAQGDFKDLLVRRPQVALLSMQALSSRLRVLGEICVNLVADDVATRIAKLILRLSARYGERGKNEIRLNIPLTHQEIADMVGTSRQTVSSTLMQLKRQGVLSIENRRILIESEELLSGLTQGGATRE
jgi:CRP/FNR family transcriptional regulator